MTSRGLRAVLAVSAGVVLLFGSAGCSAERTESNELKLVYKSGMGDDRVFDRCIAPTDKGEPTFDDDVFTLRIDRRTWNVQPTAGADETAPYIVGSAPVMDPETKRSRSGPAVAVWFTTDFYLNWDCGWDWTKPLAGQKGSKDSPVVKFFDRTGRSAEISSNTGDFDIDKWREFLRQTLALVERDVIQQQTKGYDSDTLKDNLGDVYERMEAQLSPAFQAKLREKVGGDYFCGIEYDGGKPVAWREPVLDGQGNPQMDPVTKLPETVEKRGKCPPVKIDITNIDLQNPQIQAAADEPYIQEQREKAARIKARSDKTAAELANDPNVIKLKEMENQRAIAEAQAAACREAAGGCTVIQGEAGGVLLPAR